MKTKTNDISSFRQARKNMTASTCDLHFDHRSTYTYSKSLIKRLCGVQQDAFMLQMGFIYYFCVLCEIVTEISSKLFLPVNGGMAMY